MSLSPSSSPSLSPNQSPSSSSSYQLGVVKRLCIASVICTCFVGFELVAGYLSGSLAIWSDAAHLTTDLFAFLIAIATSFLASKKSTKTFTWGFKRLESVAALFSIGSLVTVTIYLLFESISRFVSLYAHADNDDDGEYTIDGSLMTLTAMMGVVVNIVLACILRENHVHLPGAGCGDACGHDHSIQISSVNIPPPKKNLTEDDDIELIVCRPCQPCTPSCTPCTIPKGDDESQR